MNEMEFQRELMDMAEAEVVALLAKVKRLQALVAELEAEKEKERDAAEKFPVDTGSEDR